MIPPRFAAKDKAVALTCGEPTRHNAAGLICSQTGDRAPVALLSMARRKRSIRPWHRPLIVLASIAAVGLVLFGVYELLFASAGANANSTTANQLLIQLANLRDAGVLTPDEYAAKTALLLRRA